MAKDGKCLDIDWKLLMELFLYIPALICVEIDQIVSGISTGKTEA
ncbi:MAG TPA: hypothetical protein PLI09_00780 [Candidatus Hydrogenedentes bacterium]|nr:hypothetical protein [Candidatus Hydrogenedentota bacterium]